MPYRFIPARLARSIAVPCRPQLTREELVCLFARDLSDRARHAVPAH
jgi:hypothetical protein